MQKKKLTKREKQELHLKNKPVSKPNPSSFKVSKNQLYGLLIAVFAFLLYSLSIFNGYAYDDFIIIPNNPVVAGGWDNIGTIFSTSYHYGYFGFNGPLYRPLTLALFAIEWELAANSPAISHFVNVVLYSILGALIFFTFLRLLGRERLPMILIAMLLFMAHPIHSEVVTNIKSRDELLSVLFVFGSLHFLLNWIEFKKTSDIILVIILFFLGFLSKESTISFVIILPVTLYYFRDVNWKMGLQIVGILLIPTIAFLLIRSSVLGAGVTQKIDIIDNFLVESPDYLTQVITAIKILGLYLFKLVFPFSLISDYSYPQIKYSSFLDWDFLMSLALYIGFLYLGIKGFVKKSMVSFLVVFYLLSLAIYSNIIIMIGTSFGERLIFVGSLPFCLAIGYLMYPRKLDKQRNYSIAEIIKGGSIKYLLSLLIIIGFYSFKTITRIPEWKDNLTLYSADVLKNNNSARLHFNYGVELVNTKAFISEDEGYDTLILQQGLSAFDRAIELLPNYSTAYGLKGLVYERLGDINKAIEYYKYSLSLNKINYMVGNNLGRIYFNQRNFAEAIIYYEMAVKSNGLYFDAWYNLGASYGESGNLIKAGSCFQRALEIRPESALANLYVGITFKGLSYPNYQEYLQKAVYLDPSLASRIPE